MSRKHLPAALSLHRRNFRSPRVVRHVERAALLSNKHREVLLPILQTGCLRSSLASENRCERDRPYVEATQVSPTSPSYLPAILRCKFRDPSIIRQNFSVQIGAGARILVGLRNGYLGLIGRRPYSPFAVVGFGGASDGVPAFGAHVTRRM